MRFMCVTLGSVTYANIHTETVANHVRTQWVLVWKLFHDLLLSKSCWFVHIFKPPYAAHLHSAELLIP